ncbi:MAG: tetratricopeptide repeat protein [Sphingomonadaceae bacterium]|nr:tetratricopeptide repeat protein [Sphingomonadaceae bacterium]
MSEALLALTPTEKRAGSDEAFLREVDDAVRASDLSNFWTRYGRWLLAIVVSGLLAFGGWIFYQQQQQAAADRQSEEFVDAMDKLRAGQDKEARAKLATLAKAEQPGYRAMAQLVEANLLGEDGKTKEAIAIYAKVAGDSSLPQTFRDLALIRQTSAEFDTLAPQAVVDRLKPLATPGHAWFGSAGELTALAYLKMGKENLAGPIFAQIAKQEGLPPTLRSRAQQMAGALGIDTVQVDEKRNAATKAGETAANGE